MSLKFRSSISPEELSNALQNAIGVMSAPTKKCFPSESSLCLPVDASLDHDGRKSHMLFPNAEF